MSETNDASERRLIVDRFEGELAVVEAGAGEMLDLPRWMLPVGAREGSVVIVRQSAEGDAVELSVDDRATAAAAAASEATVRRLRSRDPGGDVAL